MEKLTAEELATEREKYLERKKYYKRTEYGYKYYLAHKERLKANSKKYYEAHRKEILEQARKKYKLKAEHPEITGKLYERYDFPRDMLAIRRMGTIHGKSVKDLAAKLGVAPFRVLRALEEGTSLNGWFVDVLR